MGTDRTARVPAKRAASLRGHRAPSCEAVDPDARMPSRPSGYIWTHAPLIAGTIQLFSRALRLLCPNCGKGKLFNWWLRMRSECAVCGFRFERGE